MSRQREFFHGSSHEFESGDLIQPQTVTGAPNWAEQLPGHMGDMDLGPHYTGEHVHHAATIHEAMVFGKNVYQVKPLTKVERDPEGAATEFGAAQSWTRNKGPARVIRRVDAR